MSNLIPERRMDKNGKLTTRHVKPHNGGMDRSFQAPPPPAPAFLVNDTLLAPLTDYMSANALSACRSFLNDCKSSTVEMAYAAVVNAEDTIESQVIGEVIRKRDEDLLISVAATAPYWTVLAESFAGEDNDIPGNRLQSFVNDLLGVHRNMFMESSKTAPMTLEERTESFALEFFGRHLMLASRNRTTRHYYKQLDLLADDMDGVAAILPNLLEMNESKAVLDKNGNQVVRPLSAEEVMTIVGLSREYKNSIDGITAFVCERRSFDESAVREFLAADKTPLTRGLL